MSDQRTDDLIIVFDTTLRDGGQTRGIDFSAADKQIIAQAQIEICRASCSERV